MRLCSVIRYCGNEVMLSVIRYCGYEVMLSVIRYCGNEVPPSATSSDHTMRVVFITDGSVSRGGFYASYVALHPTTGT